MGIVRFALRFPNTFFVAAAFVLVLGLSAILSMPTDIFPEIDIPVVTVIWQYTGLSRPEMEQRITTYGEWNCEDRGHSVHGAECRCDRYPIRDAKIPREDWERPCRYAERLMP